MSNLIAAPALACALLCAGPAAATTILKTFEAPGVQTTTKSFPVLGVETFSGRGSGVQSWVTDFGGAGAGYAVFKDMPLRQADLWGGAGGVGPHAALYNQTASVTFHQGVNYVGFWLSALSGGHKVEVFDGTTLVGSWTSSTLFDGLGSDPAYFGNPNMTGQATHERFAFVNLTAQGGTFDRVVFSQSGGGGFEFDNFTVGAGIPEPGAWAVMIAGFGLVGWTLRRRTAVLRV